MPCAKCGSPAQGRLCRDCSFEDRRPQRLDEDWTGGLEDDPDQEDEDDEQRVATDGGTSASSEYGLVGTCEECGGVAVEVALTSGSDTGYVDLRCQECGDEGRIEYERRIENPWENPSVQEGVTDLAVKPINWIRCRNCHGDGEVIGCFDDICHGKGRCIHDGNDVCPKCRGSGRVPRVAETDGDVSEEHIEIPADPDDFELAENAGPCPECGGFDIEVEVGDHVVKYDCNDCEAGTEVPRYEFDAVEADLRSKLRNQHREIGLGAATRVYCPRTEEWYGPHPEAGFDVSFCPYCGGDATNDDHRIDREVCEVFCENTIQSTWRFCPNCGDRIEGDSDEE